MIFKKLIATCLILFTAGFGQHLFAEEAVIEKKGYPIFEEDQLNIVATSKQPEFIIKLKSNPTTGYAWFLREYNANLITPIDHQFEAPKKTLMGASGFELWTFRLKQESFTVPHQTTLRFVYSRPTRGAENSTQMVFHVTTQKN